MVLTNPGFNLVRRVVPLTVERHHLLLSSLLSLLTCRNSLHEF